MSNLAYPRLLLKLSGEALMGDAQFGIDPGVIAFIAHEIKQLHLAGVEIAIVVGGGNIFRGAGLINAGINKVRADHMGMLATAMNALAIQDAIEKTGLSSKVLSATPLGSSCEVYSHHAAIDYLKQSKIVIFAGGTGNPFFTTDTAAALRGAEIEADLLIKATQVDGVYNADPKKDPNATRYDQLDYDSVIAQQLGVMDLTAIMLCRQHKLPLRVLDMKQAGAFLQAAQGQDVGTFVN